MPREVVYRSRRRRSRSRSSSYRSRSHSRRRRYSSSRSTSESSSTASEGRFSSGRSRRYVKASRSPSKSRSRSPPKESSAAGIYARIAKRNEKRTVVRSLTQKKQEDSPERSVEIRSRHNSEGDKRRIVIDKRTKVKRETEHLTQRKM